MSRSYCKPTRSFEQVYKNELNWDFRGISLCDIWWKSHFMGIYETKWKYYTKKHSNYYHSFRFPRYYRKAVNNIRRNHDKRELYKEINFSEYEGLYSNWNCRDSYPSWFW